MILKLVPMVRQARPGYLVDQSEETVVMAATAATPTHRLLLPTLQTLRLPRAVMAVMAAMVELAKTREAMAAMAGMVGMQRQPPKQQRQQKKALYRTLPQAVTVALGEPAGAAGPRTAILV
jgi:hypothetical protein